MVVATIMAALLILFASVAAAQDRAIPSQDWRTIDTPHFTVHFPRQLEEWTRHTASRLEAVYASVSGLVGYAPTQKVTVVVDDPLNVANGYALAGPFIFLFPTPSEPGTLGELRSWSELLSIHEFAHIAHLARPSRNPFSKFVNSVSPVQLGPILLAPRWVLEGYATYVEGKLTGSGRPHGLWRPALLRQMALQGSLPRYNELSGSESLYSGAIPYMVGSAFLEWLVEKEGEQSLVNMWSRMTARTSRGFTASFAGVYGASPAELYARFTAEVTASAFGVERLIEGAGREEGALFQRFAWSLGDPALSPSGRELAVAVGSRWAPTRIVLYRTADDTVTDAMRSAAQRAARLDPEDVPAVVRSPRPHRQLASLESPPGKSYANPRFTRDGSAVLLTRPEGLGNGAVRTDLFVWRWRQNSLRRITHGAGIRNPDPAPSASWAAATQCLYGYCSVVRVSLGSGAITVLAQGSLSRNFHKPRVSPDERSVLASVHENGRWTMVSIDVGTGALTPIDLGDNVSRFAGEFIPDGTGFVAVSTAGGIHNLELVHPAAGTARRITNVVGAALAPTLTPQGDSAYFVSMRGDGFEIRRVSLATTVAFPGRAETNLSPVVVNPAVAAETLAVARLSQERAYGLGPQRGFWVPHFGGDATSAYGAAVLSFADPAGRLSTLFSATAGSADAWRGASLRSEWRGWPIDIGAQLHATGKRFHGRTSASDADRRYYGVQLSARKELDLVDRLFTLSLGGWKGEVRENNSPNLERTVAFGSFSAWVSRQNGVIGVTQNLSGTFEAGVTGGESWNRLALSLGTSILSPGPDLSVTVQGGLANADNAPFEQFLIGGDQAPHLDGRSSSNLVSAPVLRNAVNAGGDYVKVRGELQQLLPVTLYGEWFWPGSSAEDYFATVGIVETTRAARVSPLATPSLVGEFGAGIVVAGPHAKRAAAYLMLRIRP